MSAFRGLPQTTGSGGGSDFLSASLLCGYAATSLRRNRPLRRELFFAACFAIEPDGLQALQTEHQTPASHQDSELLNVFGMSSIHPVCMRTADPYLSGRVVLSAEAHHSWETRNGTASERPRRLFGLARAA